MPNFAESISGVEGSRFCGDKAFSAAAEIKRLQDENLLLSQKRVNMFERLEFVKRAGDKAIEEFVKEHKKIMRTFLDDDNEFLMKWCEYEANTDNLANRLKNGEASNG